MKEFFRTARNTIPPIALLCHVLYVPAFSYSAFHAGGGQGGKVSFRLSVILQLCLNIPILFVMNMILDMSGIVWTQLTADIINVVISYVIYPRLIGNIASFPFGIGPLRRKA